MALPLGRDNRNSPITINPDVNTLSCRHPSHGVERYQRSFPVTMTSPEMGGGHSQPEWCNSAKGTLAGQYPGGNFSVTGSSESTKNHCSPFNCPQYTYVCTLQVDADPVYKVAVGPECRQEWRRHNTKPFRFLLFLSCVYALSPGRSQSRLLSNDLKYASVKRQLSQSGGATQLAIVSTISAAIAASFGTVVGSLVPLCAICLIALLKMGKEAFRQAEYLDVKVRPE